MRVSVLIPAFNGGWCLERTLRSVLRQTLRDFEVILIDDGSSDGTFELARRLVGDDPRFRLIRQENAGVACTRNRALALAQGDYVAPLDQDDLWREDFLEAAVAALDAGGERAALAFARSAWIPGADDDLPPRTGGPIARRRVDYRELLRRNPMGNGSCMVARRAALQRIGFDEGLVADFGPSDDWWTQLQLSWTGEVILLDAPLVGYRISAAATSVRQIRRMARATVEVIRRARREGPRLSARDYADATSLALLWQMRRARASGQRRLAFSLALQAYARHPLWFLEADLRAPVLGRVRRPFGRREPDAWSELLASPAKADA